LTSARVERRLAAVLAADVAGYSRLMGTEEEATLARLKAVRKAIVDPAIASHRGRIVKTTGDGMLVEFASAVDAARCAVDVQRGMAGHNTDVPQDRRIEFRIGIHLGDIIIDDNDIFGDGVNIAARLEGIAEPGGVCISDDAHRQVRGKVDIGFGDMGLQTLKNITEPMRAWRMQIGEGSSAALPGNAAAEPAQPLAPPDKPSIAVLPFTNMSSDPEQDYFADGITEDIITELARNRGLLVIARNSTFTYKGQSVDIKKIAAELGVKYVLEGSVRRAGPKVRFTAQLIDAQTGGHIWAERYDRDLVDIFQLQDEITRSVVATLQAEILILEGSLAERATTSDIQVWSLSKKAWKLFYALSRDSLTQARELAQSMVKAYPRSPEGHKLLSLVTSHYVFMGFASDPEPLRDEALRAIETALSIESNDEYSYWGLGIVLGFLQDKFSESEAAFERAIEINPNFSLGYGSCGTMLAYAGRGEDSVRKSLYAMRLNPKDPSIFFRYTALSIAYFVQSDFEQSRKWARLSVDKKPEYWVGHALLTATLTILDRIDEATQAAQDLVRKFPAISLDSLPIEPVRPVEAKALFYGALAKAGVPK
jgi:adenylate cyclase